MLYKVFLFYVKQGQTLFHMLQQAQGQIMQYEMMLAQMGIRPDMPSAQGGTFGGAAGGGAPTGGAPSSPVTDGVMQAQTPRAPYAESLAKRSVPSLE